MEHNFLSDIKLSRKIKDKELRYYNRHSAAQLQDGKMADNTKNKLN